MDVTLAVEDGNAKLVNIVEVAGFGIEEMFLKIPLF